MRKMRWKRLAAFALAVMLFAGAVPAAAPVQAYASEVSVYSDKIQRGKTGKSLTVSFTIKNTSGSEIKDAKIAFDTSGGEIWDEDEEDRQYGYSFPFEVTGKLNDTDHPKGIGSISDGKEKKVSLTGTVRRDLSEGYYKVPVVVMDKDGGWIGHEDLRVWITKSTSTSTDDDDTNKTYDFVLGEGQDAPRGVYPNVMNFSIGLRNNSPATVYNVKASMVLDADSAKFPFEINDANYDRMFDKIAVDETVQLDYSFAIRKESYTGYYPITMKIYYSDSSTGEELKTYETSFFVHIVSKPTKDDYEEFNEHDRTKARLIVDGYTTDPETIVAGESFNLLLTVKNASSSVSASDILLTMESEKVSDSPVFTTESGSSSVAIHSLGAGASAQVSFRMTSRSGVDQRSYGLTIKANYDSPEFKNAEGTMSVDIPVKQIPRLNTGTFEVMPDSVSVGEESNVMFGINNTGKVTLYNVMARFEADSIQTTDTYVGNIKSGETGNVDCMVTGSAPTTDDGKVKVIISYEDENGEVSEVEKELTLYVSEPAPDMDDMDMSGMDEMPQEEPGPVQKYGKIILAAVVIVGAVVGITVFRKHRKRKKDAALLANEDEVNEEPDETVDKESKNP
jgi:hypothetical protein